MTSLKEEPRFLPNYLVCIHILHVSVRTPQKVNCLSTHPSWKSLRFTRPGVILPGIPIIALGLTVKLKKHMKTGKAIKHLLLYPSWKQNVVSWNRKFPVPEIQVIPRKFSSWGSRVDIMFYTASLGPLLNQDKWPVNPTFQVLRSYKIHPINEQKKLLTVKFFNKVGSEKVLLLWSYTQWMLQIQREISRCHYVLVGQQRTGQLYLTGEEKGWF